MTRLRHILMRILAVASVIFFILLVATTSWQVISRQVFNSPSTWSEELAKIIFVWLTFFGSAFMFGERGHIAVDFLARKLRPAGQRVAQAFVQIIIIAFAVLAMIWGGTLAASIAWNQNLTALPLTIGWVYIVIPISGVFITAFAVMDLIGIIRGTVEPYPEVDDPIAEEAAEESESLLLDEDAGAGGSTAATRVRTEEGRA